MATIVRYLVSPLGGGLTDISLRVFNDSDAMISAYVMSEIAGTGVYSANVNEAGTLWGIVESPSLGLVDMVRISPNNLEQAASVEFIRAMEAGRLRQVGSRLEYYASDDTTLLHSFELLDVLGNPTSDAALSVERVPL